MGRKRGIVHRAGRSEQGGGIEKQVDILKYDFFGYKFRVYSIEWTT